jgi:hypothetical protein
MYIRGFVKIARSSQLGEYIPRIVIGDESDS